MLLCDCVRFSDVVFLFYSVSFAQQSAKHMCLTIYFMIPRFLNCFMYKNPEQNPQTAMYKHTKNRKNRRTKKNDVSGNSLTQKVGEI